MDTSAADEGSSFGFRIKDEADQGDTVRPPYMPVEDDTGRIIRKVTVLDPLKLKLLSRQNHNTLLSGLNAAKAKAKPPAPTPPPLAPLTSSVSANDGEPTSTASTTKTAVVQEDIVAESKSIDSTQQSSSPAVFKAAGAGGGSNLFRRKKVVPAVIAKKIAQKEKINPVSVSKSEAVKKSEPLAAPPSVVSSPQIANDEGPDSNDSQPALPDSVAEKSDSTENSVVRPTAFRRIKPKVAICLNPSRPKKSILKRNCSSEHLSGSNEPSKSLKDLTPVETIDLEDDDGTGNPLVDQQKTQESADDFNQQSEEEHMEQREVLKVDCLRIEHEPVPQIEDRGRSGEAKQNYEEPEQRENETSDVKESRREETESKHTEQNKTAMEEKRNNEEDQKKIEAKTSKKVQVDRKTRKIPADVWKRQMEKMRRNPNHMHNVVITPDQTVAKDSVIVEKSDMTVARGSLFSKALSDNQSKEGEVVESAEQMALHPSKEIRRICPLPPDIAMRLLNSVATKPIKKETPKPVEHETKAEKVVEASTAASTVLPPIKTIRRISRFPIAVVSAALQSSILESKIDKEEQNVSNVVPEKDQREATKLEYTNLAPPTAIATGQSKPTQTKEIKRIARLPPNIAKQLLISVNKKKPKFELKATNKTETIKSTSENFAPKSVVQTMGTLGQNSVHGKLENVETTTTSKTDPPRETSAVLESIKTNMKDVSMEPTSPSSTASVLDMEVELQESSSKARRKVEILSQVILPTASYNLEELLAGKSTDGFNTGPSDGTPLTLPVQRMRNAPTSDAVPIQDVSMTEELTMKDDDVGSEVTVTTEKAPEPSISTPSTPMQYNSHSVNKSQVLESANRNVSKTVLFSSEVALTTEKIYSESNELCASEQNLSTASTTFQNDSHSVNKSQVLECVNQNVQQTVLCSPTMLTPQPYLMSYAAPKLVYPQTIDAPSASTTQTHSNISSVRPSVPYYVNISNNQRSPPSTVLTYNPHVAIVSRPSINSSHMLLNPASVHHQAGQGSRFRATQYVLVRNPASIGERNTLQTQTTQIPHPQQVNFQQSRQHLMVPKTTFQRYPADGHNLHQVFYPTPRLVIPQTNQNHSNPLQIQVNQSNYVIPTLSSHNKAFRPVETTQNLPKPQPIAKIPVIPKIVIDSSYVEPPAPQSVPTSPRPQEHPKQLKQPKDFSPCSEEIRKKLRDKLQARMKKPQTERLSLEASPPATQPTSTVTPLPPVPQVMSQDRNKKPQKERLSLEASPPATQPTSTVPPSPPVPNAMPLKEADASTHWIATVPQRSTQVFHSEDFQPSRKQLAHNAQPPPKTAETRVIKQYICQGRKLYLTKISVKPPNPKPSIPPSDPQSQPSESGFHGFPQAAIKNDQQILQKFSETVQQLEEKMSPKPPTELARISQQSPNAKGRMKSRKPSVVTAVTAGSKGETFIITELVDSQEVNVEQLKNETEVKLPPRITARRKTFVVDDSDSERRADQLPCIETVDQEESRDEQKLCELKVKVENEAKEQTKKECSLFDQILKEEHYSDSDTSLPDEELARDILALVEKERKSLRFDRPAKRVKKRIKRRKRRKKKKNGNDQLVDLLMKHVNQESLIADIVATQQKQLPVIEISDTDEEHVRAPYQDVATPIKPEVDSDSDESETDIFAEILKPFVEEIKPEQLGSEESLNACCAESSSKDGKVREKELEATISVVVENERTETLATYKDQSSREERTEVIGKTEEKDVEKNEKSNAVKADTKEIISFSGERNPNTECRERDSEEKHPNTMVIDSPAKSQQPATVEAEIVDVVYEDNSERMEEVIETASTVPAGLKDKKEQGLVTPSIVPESSYLEGSGQIEHIDTPTEVNRTDENAGNDARARIPDAQAVISSVSQSMDIPTDANENREISVIVKIDPSPVIELNTPIKECDQICDKSSALPVQEPKLKKAPAPRAPKRKLKPKLVSRSKIRKVELSPVKKDNITDDIEDSSDPFSDRDETLPTPFDEKEPQNVSAIEKQDEITSKSVRALVDEWDSDEASKDMSHATTIRSLGRNVSFDNNGNVPCRISKNNALKRAAMLNDHVGEQLLTIDRPTKETVHDTEPKSVPLAVHSDVKSVRVSVRKTDLLKRAKTPEPVSAQIETAVVRSHQTTTESVLNLLKDWEESPVKQNTTTHRVPHVLLDKINACKLPTMETHDNLMQSETLNQSHKSSNDSQKCIVLEKIWQINQDRREDKTKTNEPEKIINRIVYDQKELKDSSLNLDKNSSDASNIHDSGTSRQSRSQNVCAPVVSPSTRSRTSKQVSIKAWITSTSSEAAPKLPASKPPKAASRSKKANLDCTKESLVETQQPAGRMLRSRAKSVFIEKPPHKDESLQEAESIKGTLEEASVERHKEVMEEAGGAACMAKKKEQESKESSTSKPVPTITNRIPIQISSEDEDDAPLAKRRKVLRKKRYMMRERDRVRNPCFNMRLFESSRANHRNLTADNYYSGDTTLIKTEPPDVAEMPEDYPAADESLVANNQECNSGRISFIGADNSQHDAPDTPPRKQYAQRDIVQETNLLAMSTPLKNSAQPNTPAPFEEHIFATPEPVRKRKRRTKQELEMDRQAKLQKSIVEADQQRQLSTTSRNKRDYKAVFPIETQEVDPSILEFQCASCYETVSREMWDQHYAKHVGLTYRINVDPAIDLCDETTAASFVARFMKVHRQVTVYCDKCNVAKKSALGLVSHRMICGMSKEEIEASKVTCEHCNRRLMTVSMNTHLTSHCPVLKKKKLEQAAANVKLQAEELGGYPADGSMLTQRGTIKRKATAKAEIRIQNITFSDLIVTVSKDTVTEGCLAAWKTQFRKAKTALCVFPTCDFTGNDEMEMRHHHEFCPSPCELFECKNCKYQTEKVEHMAKHIKTKHSAMLASMTSADSSGTDAKMTSESSEDDGTSGVDENEEASATNDDDEKPKKGKRKALKNLLKSHGGNTTRDQFNEESDVYREMVLDEVIQLRLFKYDFHLSAREMTETFRAIHYSQRILFRDLRPDLDVRYLTFNMVQEYIPKRVKSLRFMIRSTNLYNAPVLAQEYADKWQNLETFSGQANEMESIFYCGGPIIALDWLPIPEGQDGRQILAVACKKDFDEFYLADRIYPNKCLIQIWDVGFLRNSYLNAKKHEQTPPVLLYSIACDFGPIWALKFCPSGCYNSKDKGDEYDRLGLLAAAGSDGNVHIFSLARNYEALISNSYRVINLRPSLKLTLSLGDESGGSHYESHSAVKLSWSKSKNHCMIAAGYSNGAVAVWNLNSTSPLLTGIKNGVRALLPVHKIFIPDSCITAVDLHYSDDTRYLLACNADRKVVVFDLSTGYLPIEVCSMNARSKVTAACWNTHFPLITMAFDDVYAIERCALTFHQTREIGLRLFPLYTFTAEATDMSSNDHLSTHVIGTDGGDVLCHQPMPFVHNMGQKNAHLMKYILSSTISVKLKEELTDNSYVMFHKTYGVLFSDSDKNPSRMDLRSLQVKSFRRALLHEYPGIRINQVRWNPNEKSHQYYAIGYQAGFVRVRAFRIK